MGVYWGLVADLGRKKIGWELEDPWELNRLAVALRLATGEEPAGSSDQDLSQPSFRPSKMDMSPATMGLPRACILHGNCMAFES